MNNIIYRLKKKWHSYWQKYKLQHQVKLSIKLLYIFLIVWIVGSSLTILSQWASPPIPQMQSSSTQTEKRLNDKKPEKSENPDDSLFSIKYLKYFWTVIIELTSGFDVPEEELNPLSKIISVIMLVMGIIIFAIFTGQIVSMFIHVRQRSDHLPEKPEHFQFHHPIIICGINQKIHKIIEELKQNDLSIGREIVIVNPDSDTIKISEKKLYHDVWYTKGDQADRRILEKVLGIGTSSAIILSQNDDLSNIKKHSDAKAIKTALAIEGYREKTHTVLELNNERNISHIEHTKINEWISIMDYGIKLVSQAALQPGIGKVYSNLLGGNGNQRRTNRIFFTNFPLPKTFNGLTYEEIRNRIISSSSLDITLIGFAKFVDNKLNVQTRFILRNSSFLKQLNPISRICSICGTTVYGKDELGRTQKKCTECFKKERGKNFEASNPWLFPRDTVLSRNDQLIFLSEKNHNFLHILENL